MNETNKDTEHWSQQKEAGGLNSVRFMFFLFKIFPMWLLRCFAFPVGFFYFLFSAKARKESKRYINNIIPFIDDKRLLKKCRSRFSSLRHVISFALSLLDKMQSWSGKYKLKNVSFQNDDIKELIRELEEGKGVILIISHLGNAETLRGLLNYGKTGVSRKIPFTAVMDVKINANFTKMLNDLNPESGMDIIGADEIGPQSASVFEEKIACGGMVLVAGDRTPAIDSSKNIILPFLGKDAPFSSGIFYLTSLMNASVYFVFGLRRGELAIRSGYDMHVHKSNIVFNGSRKERKEQTVRLAASFASFLEIYCKKHPFQWYNFFNFWQDKEKS